jgi:hypothetical protein
MANMPRLGQGLCRPRGVHPRNRHQATFANAAEFFNSLLEPCANRKSTNRVLVGWS